jgi:beta-glucanase (GH16 family)
MKKIFAIFLVLVCYSGFAQESYIDMVWSDEFNTNGPPDAANWGYDLGSGQNGWGNNEVQSYTNNSQNVRVENGFLIIQALKNGSEWTSARVKSQGKKNFTYGRIVWRAKLPPGSGTWPALWLLGENITTAGWPAGGEIDVMEHVGKWPGMVQSAIHTPSSFGNTINKGSTTISTFNTDFHLYELLWTPEKLAFFVDGQNYYTYNPPTKNASNWPFNTPFFLIMNVAMGGGLGSDPQFETGGMRNGIDPTLTQAKMEIDYVRVYQPFTTLKLEGPNIVQKNQTDITFKSSTVDGATYQWTVPTGAVIVSGQGTSSINVNWGSTEGNVKVIATINGATYEKEIVVTHVMKPQGAIFPLRSSEFNLHWTDADNVNEYNIIEGSEVRVDYTVTTPSTTPSLVATLDRALDLSDHPVLHIRARSSNKSNSLLLRADLVDESGKSTNKSPVFNFQPLIDDGQYYDYRFDFGSTNQWQSQTGTVNASRITKINVFVDFGAFGSAGSDSLWIDNIWVEQPGQQVLPNRPSHLAGILDGESIVLNWQDNSTDETQFKVYYSTSVNDPFIPFATIATNTTSVSFPLEEEDPANLFFKVTGINASGETESSNIFYLEETVTSVEGQLSDDIFLYPNPSKNKNITLELKNNIADVIVLSSTGEALTQHSNVRGKQIIGLDGCAAGVYLLLVRRGQELVCKKFVLD